MVSRTARRGRPCRQVIEGRFEPTRSRQDHSSATVPKWDRFVPDPIFAEHRCRRRHRANRSITAGTCKTARRVRIASHYEFATHRPLLAFATHLPRTSSSIVADRTTGAVVNRRRGLTSVRRPNVGHAKVNQAGDSHRQMSLEPWSVFDARRAISWSNFNACSQPYGDPRVGPVSGERSIASQIERRVLRQLRELGAL